MTDYRIGALDDVYVYDYYTYTLVDKGPQNKYQSARNIDINNFVNIDIFNLNKDGYLSDFEYYNRKCDEEESKFIKFSSYNPNFVVESSIVVGHVNYTISTSSYEVISSNYFDVEHYSDDTYTDKFIIRPNFYDTDTLDGYYRGLEFGLNSNSDVIFVNGSDNSFEVGNSALFVNSSLNSFNTFTNDFSSNNSFVIGDDKSITDYDKSFSIVHKTSGDLIYEEGGLSGKNNVIIVDDLLENEEDRIKFQPSNCIIVSDKFKYDDRDNITDRHYFNELLNGSYLYVGNSGDKTIFADGTSFEFTNNDSYGIYIDGLHVNIGTVEDKRFYTHGYFYRFSLAFGDNISDNILYNLFSVNNGIDYYNYHNLFDIDSDTIYYKGKDILENIDDVYVASSYSDLIIHKEELKGSETFFTLYV